MQSADLVEAGMIAKRHLDDFAKCCRVKYFEFHKLGSVFAAAQVKLPVLLGPLTQHETSALMRVGLALRRSVSVERLLEWLLDFTAMKPYLECGRKVAFRLCGQ